MDFFLSLELEPQFIALICSSDNSSPYWRAISWMCSHSDSAPDQVRQMCIYHTVLFLQER